MKAVVIHEHGGVDKLDYAEVATPEPGAGKVRVAIKASGVNHFDHDIREGVSGVQQALPHVLGVEGVGVVEALGPGVDGGAEAVAVGDRVAIFMPQGDPRSRLWLKGLDGLDFTHGRIGVDLWGTHAQYCISRADALVKLPDGLDFETAAASMVCFGTAWHMTVVQGRVEAGQTVLVNAAGSGVGTSAIQVAKLHGARVIASAGSDAKLERAKELGADEVVNYSTQSLRDVCLALTGGDGVDLVIESVGGEVLRQSIDAVRPDGHLVTCGAHAGEIVPVNVIELFRKRMHFHGSHFCGRRELAHVFGLVAQKRLQPVIHAAMPMSQVREAAARTADRNFFGKMVLIPD
ncbi:zinc-binding alcohol dehydrogenase family protein [Marinibaculum pumilum]|uniref:Zinc-binding alcohol dehydrogenase family protein n=1 Tax=Marinibaculum pumilum TaxID=1766165 RepID=A0ABV7L582_9PROT